MTQLTVRNVKLIKTRSSIDVVPLRAKVGMVFQKPNPFPKSIYENVAYGPRIHGLANNKSMRKAKKPDRGGPVGCRLHYWRLYGNEYWRQ